MEADRDIRFSPRPNRAAEIEWRPWGEPAFTEARRLGRPILLSLSAVWCHWCHVMDETSYSDSQVIAAINERFVPVRVDADRRPDVDRRYNMGGWPTTAFLTSDGDVITGATYLPPDQMLRALERVGTFCADNAELLATDSSARGRTRSAAVGRTSTVAPSPRWSSGAFEGDPDVPGDIPAEIALRIVRAFDAEHGGLGADLKFPQPDVFAFMLAYWHLRGHASAHLRGGESALLHPTRVHDSIVATLDAMAGGGLCDHVDGGFYRYATRRDWSAPHYEKLLGDNARLALLYLDAAVLTGPVDGAHAPEWKATAADTLDYLMTTLWSDAVGAFGGSQDADDIYSSLDAEGRLKMRAPFVDPTVYIDQNAIAARALLRGAAVLERPDLAERAVGLLRTLLATASPGVPLPHYPHHGRDATATPPAVPLLGDQIEAAAALLDAYEATGERHYLGSAQDLAGWAGDHLRAPDGRLLDRSAAPEDSPGLLAQPLPALDTNALAAEVLLRLASYTGEQRYRDDALGLLAAWATRYEDLGVAAAPYGRALLRYLEDPAHIVVIGARGAKEAQRLHAAALVAPRALRTTQWLDPDDPADAARIRAAGWSEGDATENETSAVAYICGRRSCSLFRP